MSTPAQMPGGASAERGGLLERSDQLTSLTRAADAVLDRPSGRLVLVGGEAGAGKTALLREFCHGRETERILWGSCEALLTPAPLGALFEVAEQTGGELAEVVDGEPMPHEVAAAVLRELNRRRPTILVLEDLHWADEATLDVLKLLARRLERAKALVLASYRDDQLDRMHPVRLVLGELAGAPGVDRLAVPPLSVQGVAALAAPLSADAEDLHRKTGGNPFFVVEALAAGGSEIPDSVRDAVLARTARLSDEAQRLLEAVAIAPPQADIWLLEALTGDEIEALEECLSAAVLTSSADAVAFRHELARIAVDGTLSPARRLTLHRAALEALSASPRGKDLDRLAYHAESAGDAPAALRFAPQAAERASSLGAHREAAAHYDRAIRFAADLAADERAVLFERRSYECYLSGQFEAAIEAQKAALDCHRERGDRLREGDSLRSLGRLLGFGGHTEEAGEACREAVTVLEGLEPGRELALAYATLSQRCLNWDDVGGAIEWGTRAQELAERLSDQEILVYALINVGAAEFRRGRDEGREKLEVSLELARAAGLEDHAGRAFVGLVWGSVRQRSFELAWRHLADGLEYCEEHGLEYWRLFLLACQARCALDQGRWTEAAETAATVERDPRSWPVPRICALTVLGLARVRRGEPGGGQLLAEALADAEPTRELQQIAPAAAALAEEAWLRGRPAEAAQATEIALALAIRSGADWEAGELASWRSRSGMGERDVIAARPHALQLAGDWGGAAAIWSKLGCPYEAALALAETDDEALGRRALEELRSLGADPAAALVTRRLRERGVRRLPRGPRASTRENPAGLTARELEVLALVAQGLRNAEVADRLFVSEKTVDHHVSAVLRKLGARTRAEASAEAVRLGIATTKDG